MVTGCLKLAAAQEERQLGEGPTAETTAVAAPPQATAGADAEAGLLAQQWRPAPTAPEGLTVLPGAVAAQRTAVHVRASESQTHGQGRAPLHQVSDPRRLGQLSHPEAAIPDTDAEIQASDSQAAEPLPLFALDAVLWPNQLMMLR